MYNVIFDENVIKFLEKLPSQTKERIMNKILSSKENPFRFFKRLKGRSEYKLRIGEYRVIADIDKDNLMILILYAGHRKNIYKRI